MARFFICLLFFGGFINAQGKSTSNILNCTKEDSTSQLGKIMIMVHSGVNTPMFDYGQFPKTRYSNPYDGSASKEVYGLSNVGGEFDASLIWLIDAADIGFIGRYGIDLNLPNYGTKPPLNVVNEFMGGLYIPLNGCKKRLSLYLTALFGEAIASISEQGNNFEYSYQNGLVSAFGYGTEVPGKGSGNAYYVGVGLSDRLSRHLSFDGEAGFFYSNVVFPGGVVIYDGNGTYQQPLIMNMAIGIIKATIGLRYTF